MILSCLVTTFASVDLVVKMHLPRLSSKLHQDLVVFQEAIHPAVIERLSEVNGMPFWAARKDHSIGYISRNEIDYHEWHYPAGARHSFLEIVPAELKRGSLDSI